MAAFTTTPTPAGEGPSLFGIAKSIGAKIRDAAESAKEEKEKAVKAGESPKKGSLFKSALKNQFNPIKSKKAKGNWGNQFSWNQKSDKPEAVNGKPTGGGSDGGGSAGGSEKLKNFIAGGFSAIIADTTQMVSKLSAINSTATETLGATSRSSATLVAIKETVATQADLKRKQLEDQQRANAEAKLEQTQQTGRTFKPKQNAEGGDGEGGDGGGDGQGGFDWFGTLLGGLDLADSIMSIRSLMGGAQAAGTAAAPAAGAPAAAGGLGAGAIAGIVGGAGLAASGLGEGFFQLTKKGGLGEQTRDLLKAKGAETGGLGGMLLGGLGNLAGFSNEATKATGTALDVVGAPFRYAVEALRNPFLSEEDKIKQAENLAKFDARVRENFRAGFNAIDFMNVVSDEKGGFGNIYGNQSAQSEMMGKMSEGGMIKLNQGASIVDNPTKTLLNPGDSVIPLNRSAGKQMLSDVSDIKGSEDVMASPFKAVGATLLGVSLRMLKATDSGIAGDAVRQEISSLSRTFGVANLSTTTSLGKAQFPKKQTDKKAEDFLMKVFEKMNIAGGFMGGKTTEEEDDGGNNPPGGTPESLKADLEADIGKDASQMRDEIMQSGAAGIIDPTKGPWCAAYVNAQLERSGIKGSGSPAADSYENWGEPVDKNNIQYGDVLVGDYGAGARSHVMFAAGSPRNGAVEIIGGNQSGKVTRGTISLDKIDYARRASSQPPSLPTPRNQGQPTPTAPSPQPSANPNNKPKPLPEAKVSPIYDWNKKAEDGGSWWNPFSWGKVVDKHKNTKSTDYANQKSPLAYAARQREMMKELGYARGGKRTNYAKLQQAARIREQQQSVEALNSGKGLNLKGAGLGTDIGKGYAATYKGREAIKAKLPPGGTYESEITVGGKRFFAVKQGNSVVYVSHYKANQKNLGVGNKPQQPPKPAAAPKGAARPAGGGGGSGTPSATMVNNVIAAPSAGASAPMTGVSAPGGPVSAGRTRSMGFADFLYEDLV